MSHVTVERALLTYSLLDATISGGLWLRPLVLWVPEKSQSGLYVPWARAALSLAPGGGTQYNSVVQSIRGGGIPHQRPAGKTALESGQVVHQCWRQRPPDVVVK